MALQSSGPISISDIKTELGSSSNSLRTLSSVAGFTTSDSMSEFYSYSHTSNTKYIKFTRGEAMKKSGFGTPFNFGTTSSDVSVSVWVKQNQLQASAHNQILWDFSSGNLDSANRWFLQYDKNSNRFVIRMRTNSNNFGLNYEIEDNNSSMGLGTNTSTYWSSTNRGNTNADGWTLLTVTYDASQTTPANAFKFYWNTTQVPTSSGAATGSRTGKTAKYLTMGNNNHNPTTVGGGFNGFMDEFKIYSTVLSASNISDIYNSGSIADASNTYNTNLITEFSFEGGYSDSGAYYPILESATSTSIETY